MGVFPTHSVAQPIKKSDTTATEEVQFQSSHQSDVITPPEGNYILDLHINQLARILHVEFADSDYQLSLPLALLPFKRVVGIPGRLRVGIHPWSRRGHSASFVWPWDKWEDLIGRIQKSYFCEIVVFGKDNSFERFRHHLRDSRRVDFSGISFEPSSSVAEFTQSVADVSLLVSVNTSAVHIGYALRTPMVILCGPTLDLWIPKGEKVISVRDGEAILPGADRPVADNLFSSVHRIEVDAVWSSFCQLSSREQS